MAVRLYSPKAVHRKVAHLEGVKAAVRAQAEKTGAKAEARLAAHRHSGNAKVEVTSGKVDSFVSLVDPAALSIEFGHFYTWFDEQSETERGKWVEGLHIITGAAGLRG
ncbi:DUF5403 family protein [Prescottella equi]